MSTAKDSLIHLGNILKGIASEEISEQDIIDTLELISYHIKTENARQGYIEFMKFGSIRLSSIITKEYLEILRRVNTATEEVKDFKEANNINNADPIPRLEVIRKLGISERTFSNYEEQGLKTIRIGRKVYVMPDDLDHFIKRS
ncbi:MerR family transcriptional regulator [Croceimicrobium hydrocarbonivorans]|uniref:Helix-turn-helix domain-containing protein n=1 Tax=Croceimicrobium hydrocarbonivorans TaxID=2761580 RepID=A0A7H0VD41_9FLAO|nr:hypothetical protein [Croceimicrobium hydrocarbonivorans]QNR23639.1 hypothetical protein H4K34_14830 [Croceimicrobium hydrocarbonivorans]